MHVDHFFQKVNSKRIKRFKETGDTKYIYINELDKAYFQHDMAYVDFKNLGKRTASDKILSDKAFNVAKNSKYDGYQRSTASMVYIFLDKKSADIALLHLQINLLLKIKLHKVGVLWTWLRNNYLKNYTN